MAVVHRPGGGLARAERVCVMRTHVATRVARALERVEVEVRLADCALGVVLTGRVLKADGRRRRVVPLDPLRSNKSSVRSRV